MIGNLEAEAYQATCHTPACMASRIADAVFVGDTLFMPDAGTTRCDFVGGSAQALFFSCQQLLALPADIKLYVCRDYQPGGRELAFRATVGKHRAGNIHVGQGVFEVEFVAMRESRDATLAMPTLILPSLQVNMRAGHLPLLDGSGRMFLKVPVNAPGGRDLSSLTETVH